MALKEGSVLELGRGSTARTRVSSRGTEPVFIVGAPRSGTTLLAAVLGSHSRLSCGPETHFFRVLRHVDARRLIHSGNWPDSAVKFLASLRELGESVIDAYGVTEVQLARFLNERSPSITVMLEALTEQFMRRAGKGRWVEKTPGHLKEVRTIRLYFPAARIVRIIRDPRDAALSHVNVPWGPETFFGALVSWRGGDARSNRFFERDKLSYTLRYEELVQSPEDVLTGLCEFLGEEFEPGMLHCSQDATQLVNPRDRPWHSRIGGRMDTDRIAVWKRSLSATDNKLAEALLGDRLQAYGYPITQHQPDYYRVYPDRLLARYSNVIREIATRGGRCWRKGSDRGPRAMVFLGNPATDWPLGRARMKRVRSTLKLAALLLLLKMRRVPVYWESDRAIATRPGYCARILSTLLRGSPAFKSKTASPT